MNYTSYKTLIEESKSLWSGDFNPEGIVEKAFSGLSTDTLIICFIFFSDTEFKSLFREAKAFHPGNQKVDELQKKLDQMKLDRDKELTEIRSKFAADVEELKKKSTPVKLHVFLN